MNWLTSRCAPLVALATLALAGCDTGTALNVDLPDTASVNTQYQDFDVTAGTVRLAPVQTSKTDHFLVGALDDNIAGTTSASAYLNVAEVSVPDSLPSKFVGNSALTNIILDSTVLVMGFDRVYGSTTTPARFNVYALSAPLDDRQVYDASSQELPSSFIRLRENVASRLDRTKTVTVDATTTVPAYTTTVNDPTVRLLLQRRDVPASPGQPAQAEIPQTLITSLFTRLQQPNFAQPQLDALLKGLAIRPADTYRRGIVSFGRPLAQRMQLYFHSVSSYNSPTRSHVDTLRRSYSVFFGPVFSSSGLSEKSDPRYYTHIENTQLPAPLAGLASRPGFVPAAALNGLSYAQEGTGLGTRITFQGLDVLSAAAKAGTLTINRAEIRVPVKPYSNALFPNPNQLYAVEVDGSNNILQRIFNYLPYDRVIQADGAVATSVGAASAGVLNTITAQPYYAISVTSYLQAYLGDKLDGNPASVVLAPSYQYSNTLALNRAALDANAIKLRVYYSKR
ncbi:MAG: DUF4270 domain-containing protein [Bacteroidota bacterium]|nr:DUF4270 domain-containing protein [Bacteroidota bacterium]